MAHKITFDDLQDIIGTAKSNWTQQSLPIMLSKRTVNSVEMNDTLVGNGPVHVAMIEAFISYLNQNGLLKEEVTFDYVKRKS